MGSNRTLTVFGGSAPQEGDPEYEQARRLGRMAAEAGWRVATGGYIGTMAAVSRGAIEAGGQVVGVTCEEIESWRTVEPNRWLTEQIHKDTLQERLNALVAIGDGWIALPGGLGTLSEVALTWSLLQTDIVAWGPLVLVGSGWRVTFEGFLRSFSSYVEEGHAQLIRFEPTVEDAWRAVRQGVSVSD